MVPRHTCATKGNDASSNDMMRDDNLVRIDFKTTITLMMSEIAMENAGERSEFMGSHGREVGVALTSKGTKVRV